MFFGSDRFYLIELEADTKQAKFSWNNAVNRYTSLPRENHNYGLVLNLSSLVAIDLDPRNKDEFYDSILAPILPTLAQTYSHNTPSGGKHYIYMLNPDKEYNFKGKLCGGIDIKYNGYILIPPSKINGIEYKVTFERPILELPEEIEKILCKDESQEVYTSEITEDRDLKFDYKEICNAIIKYYKDKHFHYDDWIHLGMAFHSIFGGDERGLELFQFVSNTSKYPDGLKEAEDKWKTFSTDGHQYGLKYLVEWLESLGIDIDKYKSVEYMVSSLVDFKNSIQNRILQLEQKKQNLIENKEEVEKDFEISHELRNKQEKINEEYEKAVRDLEQEIQARLEKVEDYKQAKLKEINKSHGIKQGRVHRDTKKEKVKEIDSEISGLKRKEKELSSNITYQVRKGKIGEVMNEKPKKDNLTKDRLIEMLNRFSDIGFDDKRIEVDILRNLEELAVDYFGDTLYYIEDSKAYALISDKGTNRESFTMYSEQELRAKYKQLKIITSRRSEKYIVDSYFASAKRSEAKSVMRTPESLPNTLCIYPRGSVSITDETNYDPDIVNPFLNFVKNNICKFDTSSEEELPKKQKLYEYLMWWIAHTLRRPQEIQSVVLCLWGKQGTGKNLFSNTISKLFISRSMTKTILFQEMQGGFNDYLDKTFLVVCDEIPSKFAPETWATIKAVTGTESITINPKFGRKFHAVVRARFILTSNLMPSIGESSDNRRILKIETSNAGEVNFQALVNLTSSDKFILELAKYFNTIDLDQFKPGIIPKVDILTNEEQEVELSYNYELSFQMSKITRMFLELLKIDEAPYIKSYNGERYLDHSILHELIVRKFKEEEKFYPEEISNPKQFMYKMRLALRRDKKVYPRPTIKVGTKLYYKWSDVRGFFLLDSETEDRIKEALSITKN